MPNDLNPLPVQGRHALDSTTRIQNLISVEAEKVRHELKNAAAGIASAAGELSAQLATVAAGIREQAAGVERTICDAAEEGRRAEVRRVNLAALVEEEGAKMRVEVAQTGTRILSAVTGLTEQVAAIRNADETRSRARARRGNVIAVLLVLLNVLVMISLLVRV